MKPLFSMTLGQRFTTCVAALKTCCSGSRQTSPASRKTELSRVLLRRIHSLGVALTSAMLLLSATGCQQASHRSHRHSPFCDGSCQQGDHQGVKNADFIQPRGQSPDAESPQLFNDPKVQQPRQGSEAERPDGVARVPRTVTTSSWNRATPGRLPRPGQIAQASFSAAEPRLTVNEGGAPIRDPESSWMTGTDVQRYPDEYLLDGGDRGYPVHYSRTHRNGLDTEDTVGECVDHTGKRRTVASNSVAIYAPRFGAVRSITTPSGQSSIDRLGDAHEVVRDSGIKNKVGAQKYALNAGLKGIQTRSRVSGVEHKAAVAGIGQVVPLTEHKTTLRGREEFAFAFRGTINHAEEAYLAAGIDAATIWTKAENTVIVGKVDRVQEVRVSARESGLTGTEDRHTSPGKLHIVKLADKAIAQPGDVITFVIRFDNSGDKELHDVRIIDNLTPRLEFIEDSATCDLPGEVVMEDNEEGSLVLSFVLEEPLYGRKAVEAKANKGKKIKTDGVVSFQCRVR